MSTTTAEVDPEKMGGTPCFRGTRVPIATFFDYLQELSVEEFFLDFPDVTRAQVKQLLVDIRHEVLPLAA